MDIYSADVTLERAVNTVKKYRYVVKKTLSNFPVLGDSEATALDNLRNHRCVLKAAKDYLNKDYKFVEVKFNKKIGYTCY